MGESFIKKLPSYAWPLVILVGTFLVEGIFNLINHSHFIDPLLDTNQIMVWILAHKPIQAFFILFSSIVFLILFIRDMGVSSIGKTGVTFKNRQEFQVTLMADVLMILNYHSEMKDSIAYLEHIGTFEDQMAEADKSIVEIMALIRRKFVDILQPLLPPGVPVGDSKEYNVFIRCSRDIESSLRRMFHRAFRENHLDRFSDEDFLMYTGGKLTTFFDMANNILEDLRVYSDITRKAEFKELLKDNQNITISFQKTFFTARRFGLKKNQYKKEQREKFQALLINFFDKYGLDAQTDEFLTSLFPEPSGIVDVEV